MVRITVELLRKRSEHNDCEIQTLEELALHQQKIEKIELLDKLCRGLKIILLQNNIISKIENVTRLKHLEYLNLALNNIEIIENLNGCESLKKLDLTLNFVGKISSVLSLRNNYNLETLYLVGNPCSDFKGYREYVVAMLPQLKQLDGQEISKSDRIHARQIILTVERNILLQEEAYLRQRDAEKGEPASAHPTGSEEDEEAFWKKSSPNTPEARIQLYNQMEKQEEKKKPRKINDKSEEKIPRKLETKDGRPLNVNEAKMSFSLHDECDRNLLILDLPVPKFMDSSLLNADVQPNFVRVLIKGKIFQLVLPEEVRPDSSFAQRSKITGHLLITMPKLHETCQKIWQGGSTGQAESKQVIDLTSSKKSATGSEDDKGKVQSSSKPAKIGGKITPKKVKKSAKTSNNIMTKGESNVLVLDDHDVPELI